jgi:hypothetical protein
MAKALKRSIGLSIKLSGSRGEPVRDIDHENTNKIIRAPIKSNILWPSQIGSKAIRLVRRNNTISSSGPRRRNIGDLDILVPPLALPE